MIDLAPLEGPAMTIPWVTDANEESFLLEKPYSVLLFDAPQAGPAPPLQPMPS